jgi:hypothetical protein
MTEARASQQLAWRRMWERSSKSILGVAEEPGFCRCQIELVIGANGIEKV